MPMDITQSYTYRRAYKTTVTGLQFCISGLGVVIYNPFFKSIPVHLFK